MKNGQTMKTSIPRRTERAGAKLNPDKRCRILWDEDGKEISRTGLIPLEGKRGQLALFPVQSKDQGAEVRCSSRVNLLSHLRADNGNRRAAELAMER